MALIVFDQKLLQARLERLKPSLRAEFALACADRLLPRYQRFHDQTGQGEPGVLIEALRAAHRHLLVGEGTTAGLKALADRAVSLVPGEDDSWTDFSAVAQNAAAAVAYALRSAISGSPEDAMWAAVQGYEAADLIASTELAADFNEPGIEERIMSEEVVQRELAAQEATLSTLEQRGTG